MKEEILVDKLMSRGFTIASAESCTGGMFAATIINVPNASNVINSSIVTYSNEAKQKYCGVSPESIVRFGVVSEEVAKEMAIGIARECVADIGVSFSGIAGPGGATPNKPVGMVCMAIAIGESVTAYTEIFKGDRMAVRTASVQVKI